MLVRLAWLVTFAVYALTNPYMWKRIAPYAICAAVGYVIGKFL